VGIELARASPIGGALPHLQVDEELTDDFFTMRERLAAVNLNRRLSQTLLPFKRDVNIAAAPG
jgi:hypothetical protein